MARYDDDLRFAHVLADNADDITTRRFRALDLRVDTKPDLTPVSDADQAAEVSLRNVLRRSRPRDAVLGEETGRSGSGPRCWVSPRCTTAADQWRDGVALAPFPVVLNHYSS